MSVVNFFKWLDEADEDEAEGDTAKWISRVVGIVCEGEELVVWL